MLDKGEEILILIKNTYSGLSSIRRSINFFEASNAFKQNLLAIEIALALFQLGYFVKRPIEEHEKHWFDGGYYIHYDFEGSWPELAENYSSIVKIVKDNNFFK